MNITLDNIIFSLQKSGGASNLWYQHVKRILGEKNNILKVYEYNNSDQNIFRRLLDIPDHNLFKLNSNFIYLKRYMNLKLKEKDKYIFHSSHYRLSEDVNAINITTVHDFTYEHFVKGVRKKVHSFQKFNAITNSQCIICVSENTKRDLLNFLPKIDESKIEVIYNGVDETFCVLKSRIDSIKLPFPDYEYLLYVGDRKSPYKNFYTVIDTCKKIRMPLIIVGSPLTKNEEIYLNEQLGIKAYSLLSNISSEILNYVYNKAFCLIYPSLYEGFGIPIIESQKAGCPVIAFKTSSIPEVIGDDGIALDDITSDSICDMLLNIKSKSSLRDNIIKSGIENAKRFSWDITYNNTINCYKKIQSNL